MYYSLKKQLFPFEKILLFLFYVQTMVYLEPTHKLCFYVLALLVALVSYRIEKARPYTPLFLLIVLFNYFDLYIAQTILVALTGFLMVYLKFYHIPVMGKGNFNSGYRYYNHKGIELSVFYPSMSDGKPQNWVTSDRYDRVLYDIFFVDPTAKRIPFKIFNFLTSYIKTIKMPVFTNATLIDDSCQYQGWKVVLLSHGLGSNMTNYSSLCAWLASHGYIVISLQHHHDRIRVDFTHIPSSNQSQIEKYLYKNRNEDLKVRVEEYEEVYYHLIKDELLAQIFTSKKPIKISDIYLIGHSYGGSTVLETMGNLINKNQDTKLIKGLVCLDPWLFPLSEQTYTTVKNQNILFLQTDYFYSSLPRIYHMEDKLTRIYQSNKQSLKAVILKGTDHLAPADAAFVFGNLLQMTKSIKLQHLSDVILQLHQVAISLFFEGRSQKQIIQISNTFGCQIGLEKQGVYLIAEHRYKSQ